MNPTGFCNWLVHLSFKSASHKSELVRWIFGVHKWHPTFDMLVFWNYMIHDTRTFEVFPSFWAQKKILKLKFRDSWLCIFKTNMSWSIVIHVFLSFLVIVTGWFDMNNKITKLSSMSNMLSWCTSSWDRHNKFGWMFS